MNTVNRHASGLRKPLRLWPGIAAAVLLVLARFVIPLVAPATTPFGFMGGLAAAAIIVLWWMFFSRAQWLDRILFLVVTIAAYFAFKPLVHESISGGLMGRMVPVYAMTATIPVAFVAWAVVTRSLSDRVRRATMVVTILLACAVWTLLRTEGVRGESIAILHWRWTPTAEERLLARGDDAAPVVASPPATASPAGPATPSPVPAVERSAKEAPEASPTKAGPATSVSNAPVATAPSTRRAEAPVPGEPGIKRIEGAAPSATPIRRVAWPGFRGPSRDSVLRGVQIQTDWSASPPSEVWRRPIGPGWSSFAVDGDRLYTQEQRGGEEIVSCYRVSTGEPVWRHREPARFYESNGGPGPRATPTVHNGRVYTLGATGILNALNAATGAVVWSRNAAADTGAKLPGWGFTGSPLVHGELVIVATSGRLGGYDLATGTPRWTRATGGGGYSSPHLMTIAGIPQILLLHGAGATSVAPDNGTVLWEHAWNYGTAIVQPAMDASGDLLIALGDAMGGSGIRRVSVSREGSQWKVEERWTSRGLKPYFNDFVVHEGHAYGFDGSILACIDLSDGTRKWKGGRYGQGQMMLLAEQDLLLLVSEEGDLALVSATPDKHTEVAKFKAIEGKTWNHPVLVGDLLLVRNGEEMAAFRLSRAAD